MISKYFLILFLFVNFTWSSEDDPIEYKSEIVKFRFQMGNECRKGKETMEACTEYAAGNTGEY